MKQLLENTIGYFLLFIVLYPVALFGQPEQAIPLIKSYQEASEFREKKVAFQSLEKFYHFYHLDSALLFCEDFKLFCKQYQPSYLPYIDLQIGAIYTRKLEFEKSSNLLLNILSQAEQGKNDTLRALTLTHLANLNRAQNKKDLGVKRALQAISLHEELGLWYELSKDYLVLAGLYNGTDSARIFLEKALSLATANDYQDVTGAVYNNKGVSFHLAGATDSALLMYKAALSYEKYRTENRFGVCFTTLNVGYLYLSEKQWSEAHEWFEQALPLCKACGNLEGVGSVYKGLTDLYESQEDYQQALVYQRKLEAIDKELNLQRYNRAVAELETKYETEKKERLLIESRQKQNYLIAGALFLIGLLLIYLQWLRSRQKIRQKEVLLAAEKADVMAQLEHAEAEKLREMDALKSTFFANISHEFRTPLTLITSPIEQMMHGTFKGDVQKYYRIIHRNGKRLLNLVNQLLDLSKLESGKLQLKAAKGDIGQMVRTISGSFESLAARQMVDFQVNIPQSDFIGYFDKDVLEKILVNLISNAFKFTGEGGKISVALERETDFAKLWVSDNGIGISEDQKEAIFERFGQSHYSELQEGSGIGLALTKELTQLHGGSISVQSEVDKGTTFEVALAINKAFFKPEEILDATDDLESTISPHPVSPLVPIEQNTVQPQKSSPFPSTEQRPVVLIVEDNRDVSQYIQDTLSEKYQIWTAYDGKKGLEKALEITPDLIISDVMMPEMDGREFCRHLKQDDKTSHIPIIILTARAGQEDKLEGLEIGVDDYLVKPFDGRELQIRVSNLLQQRQKLQSHYRRVFSAFMPTEVKAESMDSVFLQKVKECIETNLDDEHFSVVELSVQVGMSRSQLHRKLSALTGFSPNEIIRNMRLERAKQLLEQKAANVSEIAYLCGFSSPAYFIKCFRDHFGKTPGEIL
ncbi:MAG TPA: response regulator [Saprospiraceae bacterium]|nr:response regulator [Saprospiraceae bacterium]HMQ82672.1 response regulator [Saprospiraceae bacterium]